MSYNEIKVRGTSDFPLELYCLDINHDRYNMSPHWHSEIEIIRVLNGTLNIRLNNNTYSAKKGEVLFVNPETVHCASPDDCVYECLVFHVDFLSALCDGIKYFIDGIVNGEYLICESLTDNDINNATDDIFSTMKTKSSGYKFKVIGALYKLLGIIVDKHFYTHTEGFPQNLENKKIPKLKTVISFINENYALPITLTDMAASAEMSPKYFCYFFKEMTNKTPVEYLNFYRVEKSAKMLLNTDLSVTDIAFSCGFNDLSYFIKIFKQIKGITPAKFRKN